MSWQHKSTVDEIRARFDADVERFSVLETGQVAAPDSPLCMDLVAEAAAACVPAARSVLDIGCGAGNYTLRLLDHLPGLHCSLVDLSRPMLDRATERIASAGGVVDAVWQGDLRELDLGEQRFDIILAAAVLHHLRAEAEWEAVFRKIHAALRPGGCFWIVDLVEQATAPVQAAMWERYGAYLVDLRDVAYRDAVWDYIAREDSPRPLVWQLRKLEAAGFVAVDVLHKRLSMAAFGGCRAVAGAYGPD